MEVCVVMNIQIIHIPAVYDDLYKGMFLFLDFEVKNRKSIIKKLGKIVVYKRPGKKGATTINKTPQ